MVSSKKASPDYFKSRMGTFLNPLFLSGVVVVGVFGIVTWQLILNPRQTNNTQSNGNNNLPSGYVDIQTNGVNNGNPLVGNGEENFEPNPLTAVEQGTQLLAPIAQNDNRNNSSSADNRTRLYNQLSSMPNLFPDLLPETANNGGSGSGSLPNVPLAIANSEYSQYQQRSISSNVGGFSAGPTPLSQAVNQMMASQSANRGYDTSRYGNIPQPSMNTGVQSNMGNMGNTAVPNSFAGSAPTSSFNTAIPMIPSGANYGGGAVMQPSTSPYYNYGLNPNQSPF
ncbi:MAG: hypothetical protein IGQ45_14820 [Cyanobacterium sp. T60_A2020_053]|nr:hypothetical protein [Cyanobacterium sp. T60_A2020_053]